jgi:hypothetical protein
LLKALGAYVANKNEHTYMMLVGNDRASFWIRTNGLDYPASIVQVITEAAARPVKSSAKPDRQ